MPENNTGTKTENSQHPDRFRDAKLNAACAIQEYVLLLLFKDVPAWENYLTYLKDVSPAIKSFSMSWPLVESYEEAQKQNEGRGFMNYHRRIVRKLARDHFGTHPK